MDNQIRQLAAVLLRRFHFDDGPDRELLLNIVNPDRKEIREAIEDIESDRDRAAVHRAFKALDQGYVSEEETQVIVENVLDRQNHDFPTPRDPHVRERLESFLPAERRPNSGSDDDDTPSSDIVPSQDEINALRARLAELEGNTPTVKEGDES